MNTVHIIVNDINQFIKMYGSSPKASQKRLMRMIDDAIKDGGEIKISKMPEQKIPPPTDLIILDDLVKES